MRVMILGTEGEDATLAARPVDVNNNANDSRLS